MNENKYDDGLMVIEVGKTYDFNFMSNGTNMYYKGQVLAVNKDKVKIKDIKGSIRIRTIANIVSLDEVNEQ